jgi:2-polyprenyl-3-methyl-5-hydroxy-6-metoxy-1,4-benzoquinol methylase
MNLSPNEAREVGGARVHPVVIALPDSNIDPSREGLSDDEIVRNTLERPDVHAQWINDFYTDESQSFYESAFDHIVQLLGSRADSTVLDAGCGDGAHAIRLAARGYPVLAMDFSEHVLDRARAKVAASSLGRMVTFERASLLSLPMHDGSFDFVLCWGVLMHIPEVEKAISELCRVVRPNGFLIISEDNMWSLESLLVRAVRRILGIAGLRGVGGRDFARLKISAAGAEYWRQTDAGPLICREARISWLVAKVTTHGFELKERIAGEFLERHAAVPGKALKRWVHKFNLAWFRYVRLPHLAMGNLLIFRKERT